MRQAGRDGGLRRAGVDTASDELTTNVRRREIWDMSMPGDRSF